MTSDKYTIDNLVHALQAVTDHHTQQPLASKKSIKNVSFEAGCLRFDLAVPYPAISLWPQWHSALTLAAHAMAGVTEVKINLTTEVAAHTAQQGLALLPGVKNIVAVASGKGGVGKSTTAANLALALVAEGGRVGLLDADIYGPSQPTMMGLVGQKPASTDGKTMEPVEHYGVKVMSIGFLVAPEQAMIWRGPMATQALDQLLRQTQWGDLDYLLIDMPPGTGDIQLTLSQRVPLTGAVIVTTPQDIALLDAQKGISMFEKVGVPILGIVENMAAHICTQCGHTEHIFGEGGGKRMAQQRGVAYLGALPLDIRIREQADCGSPTVVHDPAGALAATYKEVARQMAATIAGMTKDYASKFPTIKVSQTT